MKIKRSYWIIIGVIVIAAVIVSVIQDGSRLTSKNYATSSYDDGYAEESIRSMESLGIAADMAMDYIEPPITQPTAGETAADVDQKIIKTGDVEIQINDVYESIDEIAQIASVFEGFVQSSNAGERPDGSKYGYITIRVPAESYEAAVTEIKNVGVKVLSESTNAQDVTEQYTDLEARLSVAQDEEAAYLALLGRANTVSEILDVQRQLSNVRSRIESLEGQIQYLENRTSLSTITVSLTEAASINLPTKPFQPGETVKNALQSIVVVGQFIVDAIIWIVILGVGIGVPLGLIYWAGRALYRRLKK